MTYLLQPQHNKALTLTHTQPSCINVYDIIGECEDVRMHTEWVSVGECESAYTCIPMYTHTQLYLDLAIIALANLAVLLVFLYL